jgi:hypothetical protein
MDNLRAGRELDAKCAEALGWKDVRMAPLYHYSNTSYGDELFGKPPGQDYDVLVPYYTETKTLGSGEDWAQESLGGIRLLEDEIERRGLKELYITELFYLVGSDVEHAATHIWYADIPDFWSLLRATPEQRARAFLEAMKGAEE